MSTDEFKSLAPVFVDAPRCVPEHVTASGPLPQIFLVQVVDLGPHLVGGWYEFRAQGKSQAMPDPPLRKTRRERMFPNEPFYMKLKRRRF